MNNKYLNLFLFILFAITISCTSNSKRSANLVSDQTYLKDSASVKDSNKQSLTRRGTKNSDEIKIVSWNIQELGKTKTSEHIYQIANLVRDVDILAIQEVVAKDPAGAQAVAKIADELNRMGAKWDYQISDPTKSPSSKMSERYAFLWKTSRVSIVHRAYLDQELEDLFFREPYIAKFKKKGSSNPFYVLNFHSRKYNDKPEEEILHFIDYPERLQSDRILIAGDFNLTEKHTVWNPFYKRGFKSALHNQRTTLKWNCKNGNYLSRAIDNIYYTNGITSVRAGIIDFVRDCDNLDQARKISDHLPIFMEFTLSDNI